MDRRRFLGVALYGTLSLLSRGSFGEGDGLERVLAADGLLRTRYAIPAAEPTLVLMGEELKLYLLQDGVKASYDVATGRAGFGNEVDSRKTPTGVHRISGKRGEGLPLTAYWTSTEVPGARLTARILVLDGVEEENKSTAVRGIYIHGTPLDASVPGRCTYGCIRMRNKEIVELFPLVPVGTYLSISP